MVAHTPINEDYCANVDDLDNFRSFYQGLLIVVYYMFVELEQFYTTCIPTSYFFNAGDGDVQQDRSDLAADDDQVDAGGEGTQERNRNAGQCESCSTKLSPPAGISQPLVERKKINSCRHGWTG